jgi:acetyl-CoA acetyltransferase
MRPVYVAGVGIHPFGRFADAGLTALGVEAVRAALTDASVGRGGFQAAFCGSVYGGVAAGHKVLTALGLSGVPIANVEAGCASGGAALSLAAAQVASGQHDTVLVFGGLLSKGEPLGASALGQVVELTWQLQGAAGPRPVAGARLALAHTVGRGANACVTILQR